MNPHAYSIALCLFAAVAPVADPFPKYAVAPDSVIERVYTSTTKLESEPARVFVDGKEVDSDGGSMRVRSEQSVSAAVTDTIRAVEVGRPTKFERKYGDCADKGTETQFMTPPGGTEEMRSTTRERASPLTGKTVTFRWDGSADEYAATSDEKSLDTEFLKGLKGDSEWLELLGSKEREKGAEFEISAKVFARVISPLGDVRWHVEGKEPDPVARSINAQTSENLDGPARATWKGSRDVDGRAYGVFHVAAELKSHAEVDIGDGKREWQLEIDYEGEVLWDLEAGRVSGYRLAANVHVIQATTRQMESPDGKAEVRQVFDLTGKTQYALTTTSG